MTSNSIARLKITLDDVKPAVLRRVEVPLTIRLDRLHLVLQAAMGWTNSHLYEIRARDVGWWVVAVNQVGSVLFFLAGLAAFVRPATSEELDAGLVNWGTFAGALCFVLGGVIQAFEKPAAPTDRRPDRRGDPQA